MPISETFEDFEVLFCLFSFTGVPFPLKKPFHFEIIIDSHEVAKKCAGRFHAPFTLPPLIFTSCKTTEQYQTQKIDIRYKPLSLFRFHQLIHALAHVCVCVHACACVAVCNFVTCVPSWNQHCNQDT